MTLEHCWVDKVPVFRQISNIQAGGGLGVMGEGSDVGRTSSQTMSWAWRAWSDEDVLLYAGFLYGDTYGW